MHKWILAMLAIAALAGCLTDNDADSNKPSDLQGLDDQNDRILAGETEVELSLLGDWTQGGAAEADQWSHYLAVDRGSTIHILDVSRPGEFVEVSSFTNPAGIVDVKWTKDGRYIVVVADDELSVEPLAGNLIFVGGFYVYDVQNLAAPEFVGYEPMGPRRGPHMVFTHVMPDGQELVLGANADISINAFEDGEITPLSRYEPNFITDINRQPEVFDVYYQGLAHDMFVMNNPDGTTTMFVSNWDAGLRVVDITDPSNPEEIGGWNAFPAGHEGNLHTVSCDWLGDKRICVGSTEVGFLIVGGIPYLLGQDRSIVYVWDTTSGAPTLLGFWENPAGLPSGRDNVPGEQVTSTHNLQFEEGRVYLAHYAMGVFVLDVSNTAAWAAPRTLAYYYTEGMDVWDVVMNHGVMYTSGTSGVKALHFTPDVIGDNGIFSRA